MRFVGLVLAGGRSSRMGRDKASLVYGGRSLLEHAIATLREAGAGQVLVSGDRPGGIADRMPGLGPVGGIDAALEVLADGLVLVTPVDMPRLGACTLRRLAEAAVLVRSATFDGHPLPWAFRVDTAGREAVSAVMAREDGDRSLRALQARLDTVALAVSDDAAGQLVNINTPVDWDALRP